MPNRLRTIIIVIVAAVWAINFTAPVFVKGYEPAQELNVAFMAIMGVLTASYRKEDEEEGRVSRPKREKEVSQGDDDNPSKGTKT